MIFDDSPEQSVCIKELKFPVLLAYADEHDAAEIITQTADYFEFTITFNGDERFLYKVKVSREPQTSSAIIHVLKFVYLRNDDYSKTYVPEQLYRYWSKADIGDSLICEYHVRGMFDALNEMVLEFETNDKF